MVQELAKEAGIPKPRMDISRIQAPNAFAYGRTYETDAYVRDQGNILRPLNGDEPRGALGHETSHTRHRHMVINHSHVGRPHDPLLDSRGHDARGWETGATVADKPPSLALQHSSCIF